MQLLEKGRLGQRRQDAHGRTVDAHPSRLPQGRLEGRFVIPVKAENDSRLDRNPLAVNPLDSVFVMVNDIEGFVRQPQAFRRERFQAEKQADASRPGRGGQKSLVLRTGQRYHRRPAFSRTGQSCEEANRIRRVHEELVVPEGQQRRAECLNLANHVFNGTKP